jgi:hypothetical protein
VAVLAAVELAVGGGSVLVVVASDEAGSVVDDVADFSSSEHEPSTVSAAVSSAIREDLILTACHT